MKKRFRENIILLLLIGMIMLGYAPVGNPFLWRGVLGTAAFILSLYDTVKMPVENKKERFWDILMLIIIFAVTLYCFLIYFQVLYPFCPKTFFSMLRMKWGK